MFSFFLPPPAVLLIGSCIDDAAAAALSGDPRAHWMRVWSIIYASSTPQGQTVHLASEVTSTMLSAALSGTGYYSARGLHLLSLFEVDPASRSLFAVMT